MPDSQPQLLRSLEEQRAEYARHRGLAMPLAGLIVWTLIGFAGAFLPPILAVWSLFIGTGFIAYLGMMFSRFTGENFLDKKKPKNVFDSLSFHCVAMALLVYAIAIPFFRVDYSSLPLTVGILAGLMWVPFSWIIQHWVGIFHAVARTVLVMAVWYLAPHRRCICRHNHYSGAALASPNCNLATRKLRWPTAWSYNESRRAKGKRAPCLSGCFDDCELPISANRQI